MGQRYFPFNFYSSRLYDLMFGCVKELPGEYIKWGILPSTVPDWCYDRYREVYKLSQNINQQRIRAMLTYGG